MTHSTHTIRPFRQRMIDDMKLRKLNPGTQTAYLRAVVKLTRFLRRSPDSATPEDLRQFQLHLATSGVSSCLYRHMGQESSFWYPHTSFVPFRSGTKVVIYDKPHIEAATQL